MSDEKLTSVKMGRPVKTTGDKHTKEKILDVAIDLFSQHGYDRTPVRLIATTIGLTEGAVYRHYAGKEAILESIFEFAENFIFAPLPIEQTLGALNGQSIFRGLLAPLPEIIMAEPVIAKIIRIIYNEMHHNEKIRQYYLKEYVERANDNLHELFKKCIEKGTIRVCDPLVLSKVFNSFRSEWAFQTFIIKQDSPIDIEMLKQDLNAAIQFFEELFLPIKTVLTATI